MAKAIHGGVLEPMMKLVESREIGRIPLSQGRGFPLEEEEAIRRAGGGLGRVSIKGFNITRDMPV
jgi:hypothetical protein